MSVSDQLEEVHGTDQTKVLKMMLLGDHLSVLLVDLVASAESVLQSTAMLACL